MLLLPWRAIISGVASPTHDHDLDLTAARNDSCKESAWGGGGRGEGAGGREGETDSSNSCTWFGPSNRRNESQPEFNHRPRKTQKRCQMEPPLLHGQPVVYPPIAINTVLDKYARE